MKTKQDQQIANIKKIYNSKVAQKYDFSMPPFFKFWKKKAITESNLEIGDRVLVFCCGSGLDFPYIQNKIGSSGNIVGIDFSELMLSKAKERIKKNNWLNITLIQADITAFKQASDTPFDAGICTLGLSIIPQYQKAYDTLLTLVKPGGNIIIGDMQLATGFWKLFNPLTILMAKKFGGSYQGHKNSRLIVQQMKNNLKNVTKREFFLGSYFYCIGQK